MRVSSTVFKINPHTVNQSSYYFSDTPNYLSFSKLKLDIVVCFSMDGRNSKLWSSIVSGPIQGKELILFDL